MQQSNGAGSRWRRICGAAALALLACDANAKSLAETVAEFEAAGLPNVAKATYVNVTVYGWRGEFGEHLPSYRCETSGNAWLLSEACDADGRPTNGVFVTACGGVFTVRGAESDDYEGRGDEAVQRGVWERARLARDVKLTQRFLEAEAREKKASEYHTVSALGECFLFALFLQQRGEADAAATLMALLRPLEEKPGEAERAASALLAEARYAMCYRRFRADGDWAGFRDGVSALAAYPSSSKLAPALRLLLVRVGQRLDAPASALAGLDALSAGDRALLADLLTLKEIAPSPFKKQYVKPLWLVPETWTNLVDLRSSADLRLRAKGAEALPLLFAVVSNTALAQLDVGQAATSHYIMPLSSRLFESDSPQEKQAEAAFIELKRPATLGEVAHKILSEMLPESAAGERFGSQEPGEMLRRAKEFYAACRGASSDELALRSLQGEYGFNEYAERYLLRAARQRRVPAYERFLTEEASLFGDYGQEKHGELANQLVAYVAARGTEARPLVKVFCDRLERGAQAYEKPRNVSYGGEKENQEHVASAKSELRKKAQELAALRFDASERELLVGAAGDGSGYESVVFRARLASRTPDEALGFVLRESASSTVNSQARERACGLIELLVGDCAGRPWAEAGLCPTNHADAWSALFDDPKAGPECVLSYLRLFDAAIVFDGSGERQEAAAVAGRFGDRGRALVRERALARLRGAPAEQMPKYPSQVALSVEKRAACAARLKAAASREQAQAACAAFSVYELAALPEVLREEPVLAQRLAGFANTVVGISVSAGGIETQRLEAWKGRSATEGLAAELGALCASSARAGRPLLCLLARKPEFGGCEVTVRPAEKKPEETRPCAGYSGWVCGEGFSEDVQWRTSPPPAATNWETVLTSDAGEISVYASRVKEFCSGVAHPETAGFVRYRTKGEKQ